MCLPHARSIIKVAYLKHVSVPEDKEQGFYSQPATKMRAVRPKPKASDAGHREHTGGMTSVCSERSRDTSGRVSWGRAVSHVTLVAINSA